MNYLLQIVWFFYILRIRVGFLDVNPATWPDNFDYFEAYKVVSSLEVVNDHAERAVKLMQKFNRKVTTEKDFQDLLQVSTHFTKNIDKLSRKITANDLQNSESKSS